MFLDILECIWTWYVFEDYYVTWFKFKSLIQRLDMCVICGI